METSVINFPLGLDFYYYWAAARVFFGGGNPYDTKALHDALSVTGIPFGTDFTMFPYPPTLLPWLFPLSLLSPSAALACWLTLLTFSAIALGMLARRIFSVGKEVSPLLWVCILLSFAPLLRGMMLGQVAVVLAMLVTLGLSLLKRERAILAGLVLSFILWKPQSYLILFTALLAIELRAGKLKLLIGLASGLLSQVLIVVTMRPSIIYEYAQFVKSSGQKLIALENNPTIWICNALEFPDAFILVPALSMALVGCWSWKYGLTWEQIFAVICPVSLLSAPFGWIHESLLLVPALALLSGLSARKFGVVSVYVASTAIAPMLLLIPNSRIETYSTFYPVMVLVGWLFLHREGTIPNFPPSPRNVTTACD